MIPLAGHLAAVKPSVAISRAARTPTPPKGAYCASIGGAAFIGARTPASKVLVDDAGGAHQLVEDAAVAAMLGAARGLVPVFRMSTARSDTILTEAATARIAASVAKLER